MSGELSILDLKSASGADFNQAKTDELDEFIRGLNAVVNQKVTVVEAESRSAVYHAWFLGHALVSRKDRMAHGQWLPYLAMIGMPDRTARQYMAISNLPNPNELPMTLKEAERAGRLLGADVIEGEAKEVKEKDENKLTGLEKCELDLQEVKQAFELVKQEAVEAVNIVETQRITIEALETEVFNSTGERSRVSVEIESLRETTKDAESRLAEANQELRDLNKSVRGQTVYISQLLDFIDQQGLEAPKFNPKYKRAR